MCPLCVANVALIAVGASSTSGLAAFAVKKFFFKSRPKLSNKRNWRRANAN